MNYTTPYVAPTLVVDSVVFQLINGVLHVLLIKRSNNPFKGAWALPGGYCAEGETTLTALTRIVQEKAGVNLDKDTPFVEQLYTFDTVARDPRGHAVSVVYVAWGLNFDPTNNTEQAEFFPVDSLPELAYDHSTIVTYAHERIKGKITYTNAIGFMLPKYFTLTQLQSTYEAIFGHELDKRNFRKKFLALGLIKETNKQFREGAHRPARLYTFVSHSLQVLSRSFD
jgi:8-oxo-dGTP diphosphatase